MRTECPGNVKSPPEKELIAGGGFFVERKKTPSTGEEEMLSLLEIAEIRGEACSFCGEKEIDLRIRRTFVRNVCGQCKNKELPLITKTSGMQKYLLTSEEMNSFPHLLKTNPRAEKWSEMKLYLKDEIMRFSMDKYGGPEGLEKELERRKQESLLKKKNKMKKRIKEIRKRIIYKGKSTITKPHAHEFVNIREGISRCSCGMEIEEEIF